MFSCELLHLEETVKEISELEKEIIKLKKEIIELKKENEKLKTDKVNRDLYQIGRWVRKNNEDYDEWSYDVDQEKLEIYVGNHTEHYTRQELIEYGILYD